MGRIHIIHVPERDPGIIRLIGEKKFAEGLQGMKVEIENMYFELR
jgi:hypothetical protein